MRRISPTVLRGFIPNIPSLLLILGFNLLGVVSSTAQTPLHFVPVTPCRVADTRVSGGLFGGPSLSGGSVRNFPIVQGPCGIPVAAAAYSLNFTVVPHGSLGYLTVWPTGLSQPVVSTLNSPDGRVKANAAIVPAGSGGSISAYPSNTTDLIIDVNGYFVTDLAQLAFYPLPPCRVLDTRNAMGPLGGPSFSVGQSREFPITSSGCGIPSTAQAYSMNFSVVPKNTLGYLTVWPSGDSQPVVSTLNAPTGAVTANAALVPAGTGGDINAYLTDGADLIADINGYFAPSGVGGQSLYTAAPCRILDTRPSSGAFSGGLPVDVVGAPCAVPGGISAYVFNATVVPQGGLGYLTLWPDGESQPVVSTLNALDGAITSNMAIVPNLNGSIDAYAAGGTDLILDVFSYFASSLQPPSGPASGVYLGSTSKGLTFETIILPNDQIYALYGVGIGKTLYVDGLVAGQGQSNSGQYTASATDYYYTGSSNYANISGSYVVGSSISGTLYEGGITESFSGTAMPSSNYDYNVPASLSKITGQWIGTLQDGSAAQITLSPDGTFTGADSGCSFSGNVSPNSSPKNVFDVSLTFGGYPCILQYQTATGIAVDYLLSDGSTRQLVAAVKTSSYGTIFIGNR